MSTPNADDPLLTTDHASAPGLKTPEASTSLTDKATGTFQPKQGESRDGSTTTACEPLPSIPGYEIQGVLVRGGMGVVYKARQTALNRVVALKMISSTSGASAGAARFLVEAEAAAASKHPNVVQVYEYGEYAGQAFLVLEFLPGGSLAERLGWPRTSKGPGKLVGNEAAEIVAKVARGVQAAHEQGVVHRDLKPGNVLFDATGEPKVADFGLARRGVSNLTATGAVMGTPSYVAPEQARSEAKFVGPATDVYALGVILYECLAGRVPFEGEDTWAVIRKVANAAPPPLRRVAPGTPRDLELICRLCG